MNDNKIKIYLIIVLLIILGSISANHFLALYIQDKSDDLVVINPDIHTVMADSDNVTPIDSKRFMYAKDLPFHVTPSMGNTSGLSMIVGGIISDGYTLELNGVVIYTVGDLVGGYANVWNNYYLVAFPKELLKADNILRITINSDEYISSGKYPIYIGHNSVISTIFGYISFQTNTVVMIMVSFNFAIIFISYFNWRLLGEKAGKTNRFILISLFTVALYRLTYMKFDKLPFDNNYFTLGTNTMYIVSLTLLLLILGNHKFRWLSWMIATLALLTNIVGVILTLLDVNQGMVLYYEVSSWAALISYVGALLLITLNYSFKVAKGGLNKIIQVGFGAFSLMAILDASNIFNQSYGMFDFLFTGVVIFNVTLVYWLLAFHQKNINLILNDRNRYSLRAGILKEKSDMDGLTQLFNQAAMRQRIELMQPSQLSVLFVDIDNFKYINDTFGHNVGDEVLRRIGEIVNVYFQGNGYRYGGEELVILLAGDTVESAYKKGEHLRNRIGKDPFLREMLGKELSVSAGVASYPESTDEWSEVVEKADIAMYYAKNSGKNKCHVYNKEALAFYSSLKFLSHENKMLYTIMHASLDVMHSVDGDMKEHVTNVSKYAEAMGKYLKLDMPGMLTLTTGAYIHDIGKIALTEEQLSDSTKLYPEDNQHNQLGYEILCKMISSDSEMLAIVRNHHERFDGRGYPDGLAGNAIPYFTRIVSILNTYDRLMTDETQTTKDRAYVIDTIKSQAGTHFDPVLVRKFVHMLEHPEYQAVFLQS